MSQSDSDQSPSRNQHVQQGPALRHSRGENDPAAVAALPIELSDMLVHSRLHPPREGWRSKPKVSVHLHPHVRFSIAAQEAGDIGYGIWREEELGRLGVHGAELDSKAFAKRLMDALGDHLSIRNLEHLLDAVNEQLSERLEMRRYASEKINTLKKNAP